MTRQEQLKFCKTCLKRSFDLNKGITCNLTGEIADFEASCPEYERDKSVAISDTEIKVKKRPKEKQKKNKVPEIITSNDIYLISGVVLANVFLVRLISYFSLGYQSTQNSILYLVITLISISLAVLLREKKTKGYRFIGNLKFKLLYSSIFTIVHTLFYFLVNIVIFINPIRLILSSLVSVFIISILSDLIVQPIHFVRSRKLKSNEKIS